MIKLADIHDPRIGKSILKILDVCDRDFLPPLSHRMTTSDSHLAMTVAMPDGPKAYFQGLKEQALLVYFDEEEITGFMSFKHSYVQTELKRNIPSNHVTTVCLMPTARNKGICASFYGFMENGLPSNLQAPFISTRTWSLNDAHLHLLEKLGFLLITTLKNDRGDGIDTVYYAKPVARKVV